MLKVKIKSILLLIPVLIFACLGKISNKELSLKIFEPLDMEVSRHDWGINNADKAQVFEQIYFRYNNEQDFIAVLMDYLDNSDKCYWIGIYTDESYYTKISDPELSIKILEKGLQLTYTDQEKVRFLWVIGKKLYYKKAAAAGQYLVEAYQLAEKYPGNTPTWDSEEEYNEIMAFIKDQLK